MMANDKLKKSTSLTENLAKLGRIACVRFDNVLDAMAIITNKVSVNLPLNNGQNDVPYIVPSKNLLSFIAGLGHDLNLPFQNAGRAFSVLNKPAEEERRAQRRREASLCQTSVEQELSNYESPNFFQERIQLKRE